MSQALLIVLGVGVFTVVFLGVLIYFYHLVENLAPPRKVTSDE